MTIKKITFFSIFATPLLFLLIGCGGGGDSGSLVCSGTTVPGGPANLTTIVTTCSPGNSTPTPDNTGKCCYAAVYAWQTGKYTEVLVPLGQAGPQGVMCVNANATRTCQ